MRSPEIEKIIDSLKLPSLPPVALKILELIQDPEIRLRSLADAISADPALASKVLRQANSSFYARPRTVSRLSDALLLLGLRRAKMLALGFSLVISQHGGAGFDYAAFWRRSVFAAAGARLLARASRGVDQEEAFLGGLMHSLGVLVLNHTLGSAYHDLTAQAHGDYNLLLELESAALGFNHADLGGRLGEHWNLPPRLSAALRWWPMPASADEADRPLILCVSAASAAADVFSSDLAGVAVARHRDRSHQAFKMTTLESNEILGRIQSDAMSILELFELPVGQVISIADILAAALEEMERLALAAEEARDQLVRDNEKLAS